MEKGKWKKDVRKGKKGWMDGEKAPVEGKDGMKLDEEERKGKNGRHCKGSEKVRG